MTRGRPTGAWTLIGLGLGPVSALALALLVQPNLADALGATTFYFTLPYAASFPIFRRVTRQRGVWTVAAVPGMLILGYFGSWFGGLGIAAGYVLALVLPRDRPAAVNRDHAPPPGPS